MLVGKRKGMFKILKDKEVLQAPSTQNNNHAMWATCDKLKHGLNMTFFDVQYRAKLLPVCFAQIYADMQCSGSTDQGMVFSWRSRIATNALHIHHNRSSAKPRCLRRCLLLGDRDSIIIINYPGPT